MVWLEGGGGQCLLRAREQIRTPGKHKARGAEKREGCIKRCLKTGSDLIWSGNFSVTLQVFDFVALEQHLDSSSQSCHSLNNENGACFKKRQH